MRSACAASCAPAHGRDVSRANILSPLQHGKFKHGKMKMGKFKHPKMKMGKFKHPKMKMGKWK
ncbi:hypothetical protein EON67_09580 [archaeon]|nr:MAG: hypothetical protein EON67_09580 [archaeon]